MDFADWLEYKNKTPAIFYIGLNPRWQMYKFLPKGINVMFSAAGFWDNKKKEWRKGAKFRKSFGLTFLDCGGFTMLNQYGDYPFSVVNYANLVARLKPNYYAAMDYPCEPGISRSLGLISNDDRIEATVKRTAELVEWESQLTGQLIPVIQGYTLDEYLYCLDLYNRAGLIRDYMAVGSMCRRISDDELAILIPGIYRKTQELGCSRLHFFGLKLSPSLSVYDSIIYSRDSAVALDAYDSELRKGRGGRRWPRGQTEKKESFLSFLSRLEGLGLNYVHKH